MKSMFFKLLLGKRTRCFFKNILSKTNLKKTTKLLFFFVSTVYLTKYSDDNKMCKKLPAVQTVGDLYQYQKIHSNHQCTEASSCNTDTN